MVYLFDRNLRQNQTQQQTPGEVPRKIRGSELSDVQYQQLKSGETVYVSDFVNKEGKSYKGYLTYNPETGKTAFSFRNPNKQKEQIKNVPQESAKPETRKTQKEKTEKEEPQQKKARGRKM